METPVDNHLDTPINLPTTPPSNSNKKKLLLATLLFIVAVIIALVLFFLTQSKPVSNTNSPIVSAPANGEEKPLGKQTAGSDDLTKACPAGNQDFTVNVPSDWECGKSSTDSRINDLSVSNSAMKISFPMDIQVPIGCGIGNDDCVSEDIYQSIKVSRMITSTDGGILELVTIGFNAGGKGYVAAVTFTDNNKPELTSEEKALLIKIFENITPKTALAIDKEFSFPISTVSQNAQIVLTAPSDTIGTIDGSGYQLDSDKFKMTFFIPTEAFNTHFVETVDIGTNASIGTKIIRARGENMTVGSMVYTNDKSVLNKTKCASSGAELEPVCGLPVLGISETGAVIVSCTPKNGYSYQICDTIMSTLKLNF